MSPEVLRAANGVWLWLAAILVVLVVLLQAGLYIRQALAEARRINFPRSQCLKALWAGAVSALGPSLAVFIIMVGMMTVVGTPVTWLKLSIIGAAPSSLAAAQFGAQAAGAELGSAAYDLTALATSWWAMNVNAVGWVLFVAIFARRLEPIRAKVSGGDPQWLAVLTAAAMLGAFAFLNARNVSGGRGCVAAAVVGAVSMVALLKLAEKLAWFKKEYTLGLAMLAGMAVAMMI
jgi:hypothetical protein